MSSSAPKPKPAPKASAPATEVSTQDIVKEQVTKARKKKTSLEDTLSLFDTNPTTTGKDTLG